MKKPPPRWVKVTADLHLSGCGRYAIARMITAFQAFYFDGVGWGPCFERPADSLIEAKNRVEYHRFRRPFKGAA